VPPWKAFLQRLYICSLRASRAGLDLKSDSLAFEQGFEPGPIDAGVMDEKILTIILLDKAIPLLLAEPLYDSFCHRVFLLSYVFCTAGMNALAK
jgi:hypothetical protein